MFEYEIMNRAAEIERVPTELLADHANRVDVEGHWTSNGALFYRRYGKTEADFGYFVERVDGLYHARCKASMIFPATGNSHVAFMTVSVHAYFIDAVMAAIQLDRRDRMEEIILDGSYSTSPVECLKEGSRVFTRAGDCWPEWKAVKIEMADCSWEDGGLDNRVECCWPRADGSGLDRGTFKIGDLAVGKTLRDALRLSHVMNEDNWMITEMLQELDECKMRLAKIEFIWKNMLVDGG